MQMQLAALEQPQVRQRAAVYEQAREMAGAVAVAQELAQELAWELARELAHKLAQEPARELAREQRLQPASEWTPTQYWLPEQEEPLAGGRWLARAQLPAPWPKAGEGAPHLLPAQALAALEVAELHPALLAPPPRVSTALAD